MGKEGKGYPSQRRAVELNSNSEASIRNVISSIIPSDVLKALYVLAVVYLAAVSHHYNLLNQ